MNATLKVFEDKNAVARQFAEDLLTWTKGKEKVTIALSGGSTPKVLFKILVEEYLEHFDWSSIHFFWGDERCVPPDDDNSNFKMTYDLLLQHIPDNQRNIYRVKGENNPEEEAKRYAQMIEEVVEKANGLPQFDIMILGMGDDGHTASIFPHQMELLEIDEICATAKHPVSGQIRVSLTGKVINNSKQIAFLVTGYGKAERLKEIFNQEDNYQQYPAAHIEAKNGGLTWYVDEGAAKLLV
ncbi:MAG: 6-phosphogluconolactonase [Bacteroidota bacterium]